MKKILRKQMLLKRGSVSEQEKISAGEKVYKNLFELNDFIRAESCFCYVDFKNEIPTAKIREYFKEKTLFVPVIDGNEMYAVKAENGTKKNFYGIDEPSEYTVVDKCPDISIIPLVACDEQGNRIGFGKGYYDKYLKDKNTIKIGVCYDFQVLNCVPSERQDIRLDYIVTEKRIIKV